MEQPNASENNLLEEISQTSEHGSERSIEGEQRDTPRTSTKRRKKKKLKFKLEPPSFLSSFFMIWIFRLVQICWKTTDVRNIIFQLGSSETAHHTGNKLEQYWKEELKKYSSLTRPNPSLLKALLKSFGRSYIPLGLWKILWIALCWIGNYYFLTFMILYKQDLEKGIVFPEYYKHLLALGLFGCSLFGSLCFHHLTIECTRVGIQCRAALMVLIYRKSLKLSYVKGGVGDIVNLISIECNRIAEACVHLHYLWSAAFECIVLLIWSYLDIGIAALAPFAVVFFVLFPLQFLFAIKASAAACRMTEQITKRVHLMSEVLTAIKLIKFYTWESYYRKRITEMRKLEMNEMRLELVYKIASFAVVFTTPAVSICLAIFTYKQLGQELTSNSVFGFLFLLNSLRYPLYFLPNSERNINGAQSSVQRLQDFFMLPEIDSAPDSSTLLEEGVFMEIKNADFNWDGDLDHPHVTDLTLTLRKGELIAIVGDLGSGKSLLAAIMGQLKRVKGDVTTKGCTFGFIPQEPWFINATVRDNIMFGLEANETRYSEAIRISGLTRDLMMLSNKDESFVNELNLSPSQKQRLSLARVIYQNPDIILMEDCLGDFDQSQSKQLFKECFRNQLSKTKCILMLTQQKQFLSSCDSIIVMKGGKVMEHGTYKELKEKNVNFSAWVTDVVHIDDDPNGLIETMSEIRLDPVTSTTRPPLSNPLRPTTGSFSHLGLRRKSTQPRSSPLAVADPINAPENNQLRQIMELNSNSMQNAQLNEHTISKMIERSQNSVLTGNAMRPPANFANQDVVARTIDTNNLTVHSLHDFDVGTLEVGANNENVSPYIQFLKTKPGLVAGILFVGIFITAHGFRFLCDIWLTFLVDQKQPGDFERNMIILASLSGVIALSILLRGYGYLRIIISKGSSWHNKILEAVLRAPMSFYDVTPLGHILSFFAKHLFSIDEVLPDTALQVLSFLPLVIGTITLACVYVPWLWATLPVYLFFWWLAITICHDSQEMFQQLECNLI